MKLIEFKNAEGLTDEALAETIGDCSVSALRKWLSGVRIPRKDQMERIAKVTQGKVLPNDFYDVTGSTAPEGQPEAAE